MTENNEKNETFINETMAEEELHKQIKHEDKKPRNKLIVISVLSFFAGGVGGFLMVKLAYFSNSVNGSFRDIWAQLQIDSAVVFRYIQVISGSILFLLALLFYMRAKRFWRDKSNRDENWDAMENGFGSAVSLININNILQNVFFTAGVYMMVKTVRNHLAGVIVSLIAYSFFQIAGLILTKNAINMLKMMNPYKKGSIYDTKFNKTWYQSCDEAERMQIGIATYKTFIAANYCCLVLTTILVFLSMALEIGILPIICVGIIWLTLRITYQIYAKRAEKMLNNTVK